MSARPGLCVAAAAGALLAAAAALAQTGSGDVPFQLWGNVILDFPKGDRWLFEADLEPKIQVSGGQKWRNLDFTPLVEYYPARWIDFVGETLYGFTHQQDNLDTVEVTPRVGFRLNLLEDLRERGLRSGRGGRIRLATLVRFEYRNLWYNDGSEPQHGWRFRARFESKVGINHADFSEDGSLYGIFDTEGYVPFGSGVTERYVSKIRVRTGLGYRFHYQTRLELLYIRDWHRSAPGAERTPAANILDARLKLFF